MSNNLSAATATVARRMFHGGIGPGGPNCSCCGSVGRNRRSARAVRRKLRQSIEAEASADTDPEGCECCCCTGLCRDRD